MIRFVPQSIWHLFLPHIHALHLMSFNIHWGLLCGLHKVSKESSIVPTLSSKDTKKNTHKSHFLIPTGKLMFVYIRSCIEFIMLLLLLLLSTMRGTYPPRFSFLLFISIHISTLVKWTCHTSSLGNVKSWTERNIMIRWMIALSTSGLVFVAHIWVEFI
jgi:hypothetical protein